MMNDGSSPEVNLQSTLSAPLDDDEDKQRNCTDDRRRKGVWYSPQRGRTRLAVVLLLVSDHRRLHHGPGRRERALFGGLSQAPALRHDRLGRDARGLRFWLYPPVVPAAAGN